MGRRDEVAIRIFETEGAAALVSQIGHVGHSHPYDFGNSSGVANQLGWISFPQIIKICCLKVAVHRVHRASAGISSSRWVIGSGRAEQLAEGSRYSCECDFL